MPDMNVRGIDAALLWKAKQTAAARKQTLREYVISCIAHGIDGAAAAAVDSKRGEVLEETEGPSKRGKTPERQRVRELTYEREE